MVVAPRVQHCRRTRRSDGARLDRRAESDRQHFDELLASFRREVLAGTATTLSNASIRSLQRMHAIDLALVRDAASPSKAYTSVGFDECPVDTVNCPKWGRDWAAHNFYTSWRSFLHLREAGMAGSTPRSAKAKGYQEAPLRPKTRPRGPSKTVRHAGKPLG